MNYPLWEVPFFGGGMVIAGIAIAHVFVSHFAVGGGLFLAVTERKAKRESNPELMVYLRGHARFFVLLTLVFGAITGVGIWFARSSRPGASPGMWAFPVRWCPICPRIRRRTT